MVRYPWLPARRIIVVGVNSGQTKPRRGRGEPKVGELAERSKTSIKSRLARIHDGRIQLSRANLCF